MQYISWMGMYFHNSPACFYWEVSERESWYWNMCLISSENENRDWQGDGRGDGSGCFPLIEKEAAKGRWSDHNSNWLKKGLDHRDRWFFSVMLISDLSSFLRCLGSWGLTDFIRVCRSPSHHGRGKLRTRSSHTSSLRNRNVLCCQFGWMPHFCLAAVVGFPFRLWDFKTDCF